MWLIRISWLRQFITSFVLAGLTMFCFAYLVQGITELAHAVLFATPVPQDVFWHIVGGAIGAIVFAYVAVGAFINGVRALLAGFRAKYRWRANGVAPLLLAGLLATSISACANKPELPHATGAWVHLNGDKYPADQNDISHAPPESGRLVGAQR